MRSMIFMPDLICDFFSWNGGDSIEGKSVQNLSSSLSISFWTHEGAIGRAYVFLACCLPN